MSLDDLFGDLSAAKTPLVAGLLAARFHNHYNGLLTLDQIVSWFDTLRRRKAFGEDVPSVSEIADRACLSRQTVYALLRNERSEFGVTAQIRLSRVIQQISADPVFQRTRVLWIDFSLGTPRLRLR